MADGIKVRIFGEDIDLQKTLKSASISVAKWGAATAVAAGAAGAAMVKSGLDSADALAKESQQLGTTSQDLMTLKRAADMAGVAQGTMSTAARTMKVNLAQAAQGTGVAVDALKSLGLTVDDLSKLSLSEQMQAINKAMYENVDASERAAVASDLFGTRAGLAMANMSADTIATAAAQVRDFGAALSDVDAAKIENANDTMSQMGLLTQSVTQGMAAQFAPVLDAVAGKIFDAAKESDGFKGAIDTAFNVAVTGAGWVANAFHAIQIAIKGAEVYTKGMGVATVTVAQTVIQAWDDVGAKVYDTVNAMIDAANAIPGIDIDNIVRGESVALKAIKDFNATATASFEESKAEFVDMWNEPLPSEGLKAFVKEAEEASQKAAEAAVKARAAIVVPEVDGATGGATGAAADKAKEEAQKNLDAVSESLKSEAQLRWDAEDQAFQALIDAKDQQLITKEEYLDKEAALNEKYIAEDLKRQEDKAAAEEAIAKAAQKAKFAMASSALGNLASLMDTENRKLFEIGKAAALAQATVDGYQAIVSSYAAGAKIGGPVVGAAYAATAAVATGVQISKIASTSFSGGGSGSSASSSSGSSASSESATSSNPAQSVSLSLQGDTFSRQSVESLIEELNEAVANGARIRVS